MSEQKYNTARESYDNAEGSQNYLDFLDSADGKYYKKILLEIFTKRLGSDPNQNILDLACGPGWMTYELSKAYKNIQGADGSSFFIDHAKKNFQSIKFQQADLNNPLPFSNDEFNTIIISMAAHDVEDQNKTFAELRRILKPGGKLMLAIPNPYYAYPVGVWKRGLWGRLLNRKPRLLLKPYNLMANAENRDFVYNKSLNSHFYKLSDQLNSLIESGFKFQHMAEPEFESDSEEYNMQYRLHRFPIITYLEFTKQ